MTGAGTQEGGAAPGPHPPGPGRPAQPSRGPRLAFLLESDFGDGAWTRELAAYLRAFEPEAPLGLILLPKPGAPSAAALESTILEVARQSGLAAFPDVVLPAGPGGLLEELRAFSRIQRVQVGPEGSSARLDWPRLAQGGPTGPLPTPEPGARLGLLFEPDWTRSDWETVLQTYLEAFAPGDPALLVLPLDPAQPGQVTLEETQEKVLDLVMRTGRTTFPDLVLVDRLDELPEALRACATVQWVGPGGLRLEAEEPQATTSPTPTSRAGLAPAVSVILPTRNRPRLLARALCSLQAQTFRDLEVLVVDDGGVNVGAVLREFEAAGLPLRVLAHPFQRGQAAARNTALAQARGTWIAYLDDDDCFEPDHLESLLEAAREAEGAVAHSDAIQFREDATGRILSRTRRRTELADPGRMGEEDTIPLGCILHPREGAPTFDASLPLLEDLDFLRRLAERWPFRHVPKATLQIHEREGDPGASRRREPLRALCRERLRRKVAVATPTSTPSGGDHGPL